MALLEKNIDLFISFVGDDTIVDHSRKSSTVYPSN